jgi:predicted enzyme related to lactoylglutathione lyase
MKLLALSLILAAACGGSSQHASAPAAVVPVHHGLQIKLASIYVDDQDKALHFYTDVIGFVKKDDITNGPYRWLTVVAPGDADGGQLQLAPNGDPAAKAYQQAMFEKKQPAAMLFTDDVKADVERIKAKGGELSMPPTDIGFAIIAQLPDGAGNIIQLTQLAK